MSTQGTTWRTPTARWRENSERTAWIVLLACFAVFMLLAVAIPTATVYFVRYASVAQVARLEPTQGTVLLYDRPEDAEPVAITAQRDNIHEGARVVAADDATQATLALNSDPTSGNTLGSVQIYDGTDLTLQHLRRPVFERSREPFRTDLLLNSGQARVFTSQSDSRAIEVTLHTPHGTIQLAPGSYQVSVAEEGTELTVRSGQATLSHVAGDELTTGEGQRAWLSADGSTGQAATPEINLVENGNFTPPVLDTWPSYQIAEASTTPGKVQFSEGEDGRQVAQFIRMGDEKLHTEVGIRQEVNKAVNVYDDLRIQVDVKTLFQSLPGAGSLNSEFPLRAEISYREHLRQGSHLGSRLLLSRAGDRRALPDRHRRHARAPGAMVHLRVAQSDRAADGARHASGVYRQHSHLRQRPQLPEHGQRSLPAGRIGFAAHAASCGPLNQHPNPQECAAPREIARRAARRLAGGGAALLPGSQLSPVGFARAALR